MAKARLQIVVAGDVCIDWLSIEMEPVEDKQARGNWQLKGGRNMFAHRGGAWLTSDYCQQAVGELADVCKPETLGDLEAVPPEDLIHSMLMLGRFRRYGEPSPGKPYPGEREKWVWGVRQFEGFAGPLDGRLRKQLKSDPDNPDAAIVVLDDAGNGFRDSTYLWPKAIEAGRKPIILYKVRRPLLDGPLWEHLQKHHLDRTIAILNADELRAQGASISRQLSWERTATELVIALHHHSKFHELLKCAHIIIPLGLEGVVRISGSSPDKPSPACLWHLPDQIENDLLTGDYGSMTGIASAFTAAMVSAMLPQAAAGCGAAPPYEVIDQGIHRGMHACRFLLEHGFGPCADEHHPTLPPAYPGDEIFSSGDFPKFFIQRINLPPVPPFSHRHDVMKMSTYRDWRMLDSLRAKPIRDLATITAIDGRKAALPGVPVAKFGQLETIDRWEIENYRTVRNLMREYLRNPRPERPLCLAVFGRPGSGKSFGVTQVAQSIDKEATEKLDFNLSQWDGPDKLAGALHRVRDSVLRGKVPLVFFDEFDCRYVSPLGWLKYFLAPMQDGVFVDGAVTHLIGKAIFVFAGGTSSSFQEFSGNAAAANKNSKAIDFLSRLRGHVDIFGIDPLADASMLRRAMMFRSLLERRHKKLFDRSGHLRIDPGLLSAFLSVPRYAHGVRSMEAIIEMSRLQGAESFVPSLLPPRAQLDLHTDGQHFYGFLEAPGPLDEFLGKIAIKLHERYLAHIFKDKTPAEIAEIKRIKPAAVDWSILPGLYKDSNRDQALHFPVKLAAIGCELAPLDPAIAAAKPFAFTNDEIEKLAELEHERWIIERRLQQPYHTALIPWDKLPEIERDKDRDAVKAMPEILNDVGLMIIRSA